MCRNAFQSACSPPRPAIADAAGAFLRFGRDCRGAIAIDWMALSAGLAVLAASVVGVLAYVGLIDGEAIAARLSDDARTRVGATVGIEKLDPGGQFAPGTPVFDPGGRDPGAVGAPGPLPPGAGSIPGDSDMPPGTGGNPPAG